jgi:hypothetical protein
MDRLGKVVRKHDSKNRAPRNQYTAVGSHRAPVVTSEGDIPRQGLHVCCQGRRGKRCLNTGVTSDTGIRWALGGSQQLVVADLSLAKLVLRTREG